MARALTILTMGLWAALAAAQDVPEAPAPLPAEPVRTVDSDLSVGGALKARIDLAIGDVAVRGEDVDRVVVRLLIFCEKKPRDRGSCDEHARDVSIRGSSDGDGIRIGVERVSQAVSRRLRLRLEVTVPKNLAVEVNVRDGQVRVDDLLANTKVDVSKGTVDVFLPEKEVAELKLRARGEARVERAGEVVVAKGTLSGELRWTRQGGLFSIDATSRFGDVRVVLN